MRLFDRFKIWLEYLYHGRSRYLIHSPFVFSFINNILRDDRVFYAYESIEKIRERLQKDDRLLIVTERGAGKNRGQQTQKKVHEIANGTAISPKWGILLFKISNYFKPTTILEIGTGLGISTSYLSEGSRNARIISLEGNSSSLEIAHENFKLLGLPNIETLEGNFDDTLPMALASIKKVDMVFIDGNHQSEATLRYFRLCLPYSHVNTVMIFDDINWSADMQHAWQQIASHPNIKLAIGLHRMGIVFFKDEFKMSEYLQLYH